VVKKNPQSLTIYFGGTRGRTLRDTYLKMRTEQVHPDGTMTSEPILKDLKPNADSYTFSHPQGLLFSTQFAQPALTVMETATFADLRAKGLVQDSAIFAGHSLGEYGALAAVAEFMPIESLAEVSFYRGLTMQASMKRDAEGRTEFSMMAVNPSRVCKGIYYNSFCHFQSANMTPGFSAEALNSVVKTIAHTSGLLLEIVNHNVEGQQYVCAGHVSSLPPTRFLVPHLTTFHRYARLTLSLKSSTTSANPHPNLPPSLTPPNYPTSTQPRPLSYLKRQLHQYPPSNSHARPPQSLSRVSTCPSTHPSFFPAYHPSAGSCSKT
jgi:fatty acid synthase subunit beta